MKKIIALLLVASLASPIAVMAANGNGYNNGNNGYSNGYDYYYENGNGNGYENGYYNHENGNGYNGYNENYENYQNGYSRNYQNGNATKYPTALEGYVKSYDTIVVDGQEFTIKPGTPIIDAETGQPKSLTDVEGEKAIIYYCDGIQVVIVNISESMIPPQFGIVEAIDRNNEQVTVTVRGGSLLVTIPTDSYIDPFLTRNVATIHDVHVGSHLLMWYPMVSASYPGLATAQRTVILNRVQQTTNEAEYTPTPYSNGYSQYFEQRPLTTTPAPFNQIAYGIEYVVINGVTMVPLRTVAEAAGFKVTWNEANRTVSLSYPDRQIFTTLAIGHKNFNNYTLEAAPIISNDRTFVPASFFNILLGL